MFYNITINLLNGDGGYLGLCAGKFISVAPNRNCVVWVKTKEKAQRIVKIITKRWNIKSTEIKEYDRILL